MSADGNKKTSGPRRAASKPRAKPKATAKATKQRSSTTAAGKPASSQPKPAARKQRPAPGSTAKASPLSAYFESNSPAVLDLFVEKGKRRSWTFQAADRRAALKIARESDLDLSKTRRLLFEAIEAEGSRYAHVAADFAMEAAADDLAELVLWPPGDEVSPTDALAELVASLDIAGSEGDRRRRAFNLMMAMVDVLYVKSSLSAEDALPVVLGAVGVPPKPGDRKANRRRSRLSTLTDPRNGLRQVQSLVGFVEPWHDRVAELSRSAAAAEALAETALQELEAERHTVDDLNGRLGEAAASLQEALGRVDELSSELKNTRVRANVDDDALRKRVSVFMNMRLKDLLVTAREASEVDPPRSATTVRLLVQATDELNEEIKWLRSSV